MVMRKILFTCIIYLFNISMLGAEKGGGRSHDIQVTSVMAPEEVISFSLSLEKAIQAQEIDLFGLRQRSLLGSGGQGEVFLYPFQGKDIAVKILGNKKFLEEESEESFDKDESKDFSCDKRDCFFSSNASCPFDFVGSDSEEEGSTSEKSLKKGQGLLRESKLKERKGMSRIFCDLSIEVEDIQLKRKKEEVRFNFDSMKIYPKISPYLYLSVCDHKDGFVYLFMERMEEDLSLKCLRENNISFYALTKKILDIVSSLEKIGVIHRDFKIENFMFEDSKRGLDSLRLIDYGHAIIREDALLERYSSSAICGTPTMSTPTSVVSSGNFRSYSLKRDLIGSGYTLLRLFYENKEYLQGKELTGMSWQNIRRKIESFQKGCLPVTRENLNMHLVPDFYSIDDDDDLFLLEIFYKLATGFFDKAEKAAYSLKVKQD
jgi:serine/threonine protein kinase